MMREQKQYLGLSELVFQDFRATVKDRVAASHSSLIPSLKRKKSSLEEFRRFLRLTRKKTHFFCNKLSHYRVAPSLNKASATLEANFWSPDKAQIGITPKCKKFVKFGKQLIPQWLVLIKLLVLVLNGKAPWPSG